MIAVEITYLSEEIADKMEQCLGYHLRPLYMSRVAQGLTRLWRFEKDGKEGYCLWEIRGTALHILGYQGRHCLQALRIGRILCERKGLHITAEIRNPAMLRLVRRGGMFPTGG